MSKFPKPWFRKDRRLWYVQLHGVQHNLGHERDPAFRKYAELLTRPAPVVADLVAGVVEGFLVWCKQHRKPRTFEWYRDHLSSFVSSLPKPKEIRVDQLKPFHLQSWVDSHQGWGPCFRRGAITAVQRAFAWAERLGHIDKSPVRGVEKPKANRRDQTMTAETFVKIRDHYRDGDPFRDLLEFCWETGARPQEVKQAEARHYLRDNHCLAFPPEEAKGGQRWRIILLTERAIEIIERLVRRNPTGKIFLNEDRVPWTKDAIGCRFGRLKKVVGERYALYSLRHGFADRLLTGGTDSLTVATIMGHKDTRMLAAHYSHLERQAEFLRKELTKGSGGSGSASASA